jgi:hypothetical protein
MSPSGSSGEVILPVTVRVCANDAAVTNNPTNKPSKVFLINFVGLMNYFASFLDKIF